VNVITQVQKFIIYIYVHKLIGDTNITLQKFVVLMVSLVVAMLCVIVSLSSFMFHTHHKRKLFVGSIGIVTSMSMYCAPLVAVVSTISYHRIMDYRYLTGIMHDKSLQRQPNIDQPFYLGLCSNY
jgi:hypothetical protein